MAKKDRIDSVVAHEAVPHRPTDVDAANKPDAETAAAAPEQLQFLSLPPEVMVQQILERQAVFGF